MNRLIFDDWILLENDFSFLKVGFAYVFLAAANNKRDYDASKDG
jgi:hypothetical protein